jgi:osmotically-inducible protein OsmY
LKYTSGTSKGRTTLGTWAATAVLPALLCLASGCSSFTEGYGYAEATQDEQIERAAMDRLTQDDLTAPEGLGVRVENGVATVYGSVPTAPIRLRALSVVNGTPGVTEVVDKIVLR